MAAKDYRHAGELIVMGLPGPELDAATRDAIRDVQPGGFIIFSRNIKAPEQLRGLLDELRGLVDHEPVITIDQEGGRVSRLREIGAEPPSAQELRDDDDQEFIHRHGELTGQLLRLYGFNLNLAPVLDISFDDEADNSLKGRCWGRTPEEVNAKARLFTDAMRAEGVLCCPKHFPGYTMAGLDPHHDLPRIERTREELEACEWKTFREQLPVTDVMMIGHAFYPDLDPSGTPSSLSAPIITGLLREEWGFGGIVMSDDVDMGALINYCPFGESLQRAVTAGTDLLLLCHRLHLLREAAEALAALPDDVLDAARARLRAFRTRLAPPAEFSLQQHREINEHITELRVAVLGEHARGQRSAEDGKRSPVELY
ncbi:MAG: glycoside hydrolase family 3 N-terminal domain-containing protein [Verrucomicrobiota bacterium]